MVIAVSSESVVERLKGVVGPQGYFNTAADMAPHLVDQRGRYRGVSPLVLRPASTAEVAEVVRICREVGIGVVPQGGNTSLVGGSVPDESGEQVVLSLSRMNRIRGLDALNSTMTVEAGCVLAAVQAAAEEADLMFPLSLAAEGSCQIGGNLATNAGGTAVLRYGNARELVLGLEVVLASGEVWDGLRRLRKDNTGYDLKQVFLGAEGTLGIITAAVLKLFPRHRQTETALVAVPDVDAALRLLGQFRESCGNRVTTYEYMGRTGLALVLKHISGTRDPFERAYDHYVLVEIASGRIGEDLAGFMAAALDGGYRSGEVIDAAIAANSRQAAELWCLRESIPEAQRRDGAGIKHDVAVSVSRVPSLLKRAGSAVAEAFPEATVVAFGHLGDGNIHFNLNQPAAMAREDFLARTEAINRLVHDIVFELEGSFSAEHGIGRLKRGELVRYRSPVELRLMRALKAALDPDNVLNPGKVV